MPYISNDDCDNQYANIPSQNWATDLTIPPLPPLLPRDAKPKFLIPRPPTLPPNAFRSISNSAFLQVMTAASAFNKQDYTESPFRPCHLFFYGSLMDPEILQAVLGLPEIPAVRCGSITGSSVKTRGIYPALVRDKNGKVSGTLWGVASEVQFLRLAEYETSVRGVNAMLN